MMDQNDKILIDLRRDAEVTKARNISEDIDAFSYASAGNTSTLLFLKNKKQLDKDKKSVKMIHP